MSSDPVAESPLNVCKRDDEQLPVEQHPACSAEMEMNRKGSSAIVMNACGKPQVKKPKRVLHFSDGTLEEYSSEEEEEKKVSVLPSPAPVNPKLMRWHTWMWYLMTYSGNRALAACDYLGEGLANFFGITAPRYQNEIQEFSRMTEEAEEKRKATEERTAGWQQKKINEKYAVTEQTEVSPLEGKKVENKPKSTQWERF